MDSLKAMLFGRKLIACILDCEGFFHNEDLLVAQQKAELFDENSAPDVSWFLSNIIYAKYDLIRKMFREFKLHENWKDPSYFGSRVLQAAPTFFQNGYSPGHFLAFCAVVSGVVLLYYHEEVDCPDFADKAADIIGLVLSGHMITGEFFQEGSWQRLCEVGHSVSEIDEEQNSC